MAQKIKLDALINAGLIAKDAELSIEAGGRTHTATLRHDLHLDYTIRSREKGEDDEQVTTDEKNVKVCCRSKQGGGVLALPRR